MRRPYRDPDPDPAGDLCLIANHARLAGLFGHPREVFADPEAEKASIEGYAAGKREMMREILSTAVWIGDAATE